MSWNKEELEKDPQVVQLRLMENATITSNPKFVLASNIFAAKIAANKTGLSSSLIKESLSEAEKFMELYNA